MTRENAEELLPVMKAFADGKQIEYSKDGEIWTETETPTWDTGYVYRIKSEPNYRPFNTVKECWDEMVKHKPFGWLSSIRTGNIAAIGSVNEKNGQLIIKWATNECLNFSAADVSSDYVFADGSPFGIKDGCAYDNIINYDK